MNYARLLFDQITEPNVFIWNTMIKGYCRTNCSKNAVFMYLEMLIRDFKPDAYTFPFLLKGFTCELVIECGRELHAHIIKFGFVSNVFVQNAVIHIYSLCGKIDMAQRVFSSTSKRDAVTYNALISGYNRSKLFDKSIRLFNDMLMEGVLPTPVTLVSVLSACSKLKDLDCGKRVHQYIKDTKTETNLILENALVDMYAACVDMDAALEIFESMKKRDVISWTTIVKGFVNLHELDLARKYFDEMPERDGVSWTAMIDGYLSDNRFKEALMLFREMQNANIKPDEFTMVSILTACAHLGALELGEWIRTFIAKNKIKYDVFVGNALIDMYFKCGNVEKAKVLFEEMSQKDKVTWTAMIVGLAINGNGEEALGIFSQMLKLSIKPDEITFLGVLCACAHSGMVEEGKEFFASMSTQYGIEPNLAHYGCMVDLLGKAGKLKEAHDFIKSMPLKPNSIVWGSLLGACRVHKNLEMAEVAAKQILELEPDNGAVYVVLCNIYAAFNRWEDLRYMRKTITDRGIKKAPGGSLIDMNGFVHEFFAGDESHSQSKEIYSKLDEIMRELKLFGYMPRTSEVYNEIGEEERESALYRHSEKLAIAFGMICSGPTVPIRIVKNLRMCLDCHQMAKLVSKVYARELIVRDRTRFHHFRDGSCSCQDYW